MSYWQFSADDWKIRKPASFSAHLQLGFIIASIGPILSGGHAVLWALAAIAAGLAWEWGYYFVVAKVLPQAPMIEVVAKDWPKIGRGWRVSVVGAEKIQDGFGLWEMEFLLIFCPDRALPRAFDMVPFVLGAGLGLWFTVWRLGG